MADLTNSNENGSLPTAAESTEKLQTIKHTYEVTVGASLSVSFTGIVEIEMEVPDDDEDHDEAEAEAIAKVKKQIQDGTLDDDLEIEGYDHESGISQVYRLGDLKRLFDLDFEMEDN